MKIILIAAISKLGKIGDVVEVKNGYAKNFLIPNKKAIVFTANNYKIFESKKHEFEQENIKNLDIASKVQLKIIGKDIVVIENASDDGRLYGSVSSSLIANKINDVIGEKLVSRSIIVLKKPIKEIGVYDVKLALHSDLSFSVRLIVTRSESEIEMLLKAEKKNATKAFEKDLVGDSDLSEESKANAVLKPKKVKKTKAESVE